MPESFQHRPLTLSPLGLLRSCGLLLVLRFPALGYTCGAAWIVFWLLKAKFHFVSSFTWAIFPLMSNGTDLARRRGTGQGQNRQGFKLLAVNVQLFALITQIYFQVSLGSMHSLENTISSSQALASLCMKRWYHDLQSPKISALPFLQSVKNNLVALLNGLTKRGLFWKCRMVKSQSLNQFWICIWLQS